MKRRFIAGLLALVMLLASYNSVFAAGTLSNFVADKEYKEGHFIDVNDEKDWFAPYVATAVRLGLVNGTGVTEKGNTFSPLRNVSIAETIAMAARLHKMYYEGNSDFVQGKPWYKVYVDYAIKNKIISGGYVDYQRAAKRHEYAKILANAFPAEAMKIINTIEDNAIPDVPISRSYGPAVYKLYRAGILTGDQNHKYNPEDYITRSEISTFVARMADESSRVEFNLNLPNESYNAKQISAMCADGVFMITVYMANGESKTGSGFFINKTGMAVTNFHVVDGGVRATAKTTNGRIYDISKYYDVDIEKDLALIQVDGTGFTPLELGNSDDVVPGETVFAIGSPFSLENTITEGIVSNTNRILSEDDVSFIQHSAPISPGNSGGPVINDQGQVIAITTRYISEEYAQNLNLALPINLVEELSSEKLFDFDFDWGYSMIDPNRAPLNPVIEPESVELHLKQGEIIGLMIYATEESGLEYAVSYYIDDDSIVDCMWPHVLSDDEVEYYDWINGTTCMLYIEALEPGYTYISLSLDDERYDTAMAWALVDIFVE